MRNRWIVVALALVAGTAFALSVQMGMWWSVGEVTIGPFGTRHCLGAALAGTECRSAGLAWLGGSELWMRSAIATGASGLVAMFALVIVAGAVAARRIPKLAAKAALVAIATAIACSGYFVFGFPGVGAASPGDRWGASLGSGAMLFGAAIVIGLAAVIGVLRSSRTAG